MKEVTFDQAETAIDQGGSEENINRKINRKSIQLLQ